MGAELWNSTAHINPYLDFPSPVTWTKGCSNASLSCWRNGSTDGIKTRYYILHTTYYRYSFYRYRYILQILTQSASLNKNPEA